MSAVTPRVCFSTIVSVYATANTLADSVTYLYEDRAFIPKDDLLAVLRKDTSGRIIMITYADLG
jgi:hypothetical protein